MADRKPYLISGRTGDWEVVMGLEVHAQVASNSKLFSGASTAFGNDPEHQRLAGRCGHAGHAAGDQQVLRRAGGEDRPRPQRRRSISSRASTGRTISIPTCRRAIRSRSSNRRSSARARSMSRRGRRLHLHRRHRAAAPRAGRRQVDPRPRSQRHLCRPQPVGRGADGDRLEAGYPLACGSGRLCEEAALHPDRARHLRWRHGEGQSARRRERLGLPAGRLRSLPEDRQLREARHALRNQERQLVPLHPDGGRIRSAPPDRHPRGWRQDRPGDAALQRRQGRDALHALEGRRARLPLLPRSGPAAARTDGRVCRKHPRRSCRNCRTRSARGS